MIQERDDKKGGPSYNQFDRVRVETMWKDRLRKETDVRRAVSPSGFQLNLANSCTNGGLLRLKHSHNRLEIVTEKDLKQSPQARTSLKGLEPGSLPVMAIKHVGRGPQQKWDMPLTSSQDSGWLLANPMTSQALLSEAVPMTRSTSGPLPGTMAVTGFGGRSSFGQVVSKPLSLTTPANDHVLGRIKSSPAISSGDSHPSLKRLNNRRWHRPKNTCDVSQYAEAYQVLMHCSPFNQSATR
mmetsp:Transcript_9371/g.21312  ORF Transcript_9371/g.21312 Transcript_9371/m.21312 type:complete len:240 (-) Transcript_9371:135-854(-)